MSADGLSPIKITVNKTKSVTEQIPEDVSRAKAHAWLEIISPITEWAGLKGDALRHKRDILRLERETNLVELALRLKQKLDGQEINPIKNKILVPALERASLESPDSDFVERWANLLAAEAIDPADDTGLFSAILAEMGGIESKMLDRVQNKLINADLWSSEKVAGRTGVIQKFLNDVGSQVRSVMSDLIDQTVSERDGWSKMQNLFDASPAIVFGINHINASEIERWTSVRASAGEVIALDILEARNLMKREACQYLEEKPFSVTAMHYFSLTNLGVRFLQRVSGNKNGKQIAERDPASR